MTPFWLPLYLAYIWDIRIPESSFFWCGGQEEGSQQQELESLSWVSGSVCLSLYTWVTLGAICVCGCQVGAFGLLGGEQTLAWKTHEHESCSASGKRIIWYYIFKTTLLSCMKMSVIWRYYTALELLLEGDEASGLKSFIVLTSGKGRYAVMTEAAPHCI